MNTLLRRTVFVLAALVLALALACLGPPIEAAQADPYDFLRTGGPNEEGPHNENGNSTLDIYRGGANFGGHLQEAIEGFRAADTGVAPRPRIVSTLARADIHVFWTPCDPYDGDSESFFRHREYGVDDASIGTCDAALRWLSFTIQHEAVGGHSSGLTHYHDGECTLVESVMCHKRWDDGHLTEKDAYDLRQQPNKWHSPYTPSLLDDTFRVS